MRNTVDVRPSFLGKGVLTAIVVLFSSILLTACGIESAGNSPSETAVVSKEPKSNRTTNSDQSSNEKRVVAHAMGETEITGTPQRVVVLTNEGIEALLALGVKPVGATRSWSGEVGEGTPWYAHIQAEMENVIVVGGEEQPDVELIWSLKPDLIIGNATRQGKLYRQLSKIAPTIFSETLSADWKPNLELYAEALNRTEQGERVVAEFDQRITDARQKLGKHTVMTVSLVRFLPNSARVYYKDSFAGVMVEQLGFARPEPQNKQKHSARVKQERIPDLDGDVLFFSMSEEGPDQMDSVPNAASWQQHSLWSNLQAVQNGRVFEVNDVVWNRSGGVKAAHLMLDDVLKYVEKIKG
ncbi:ABC transporter substrate-binding protein [Paenibacillus sp. 481]|uniref:ABC transporter substrate-binding protein n=1 Tax=Paenibacillus sp. 481 TaxID=2835869 RepID=UPI001E64775C|nr:iron-siderophore ABC transporter substrate-binding protein [Paenibacillus sp. 481]UHA72233.1 iron-siderophore ABC transporter substrate-binding protein [Paenibacillus sp. 481]